MALSKNAMKASSSTFVKATSASRRVCVVVRAEEGKAIAKVDRKAPVYPGVSSDQALTYLDGQTLPGDFGFDPLGLLDPVNSGGFVNPQWLAYSEVIHGRWAMLGAAGCLAPEALAKMGVTPASTGVVWFRSGVIPPAGADYTYWTDPYSLFLIEVVLMQFAELKRLQDFRFPGSQAKQAFVGLESGFAGSGNPAYPGGRFFNFAGLGGGSAEEMKTLKLKEIKNGRLAMIAMLGFAAQAVQTGTGPVQNLVDHLASPTGANLLQNLKNGVGGVL